MGEIRCLPCCCPLLDTGIPDKIEYRQTAVTQLAGVIWRYVDAAPDGDLADLFLNLRVGGVIGEIDQPADVLAEPGDLFLQFLGG